MAINFDRDSPSPPVLVVPGGRVIATETVRRRGFNVGGTLGGEIGSPGVGIVPRMRWLPGEVDIGVKVAIVTARASFSAPIITASEQGKVIAIFAGPEALAGGLTTGIIATGEKFAVAGFEGNVDTRMTNIRASFSTRALGARRVDSNSGPLLLSGGVLADYTAIAYRGGFNFVGGGFLDENGYLSIRTATGANVSLRPVGVASLSGGRPVDARVPMGGASLTETLNQRTLALNAGLLILTDHNEAAGLGFGAMVRFGAESYSYDGGFSVVVPNVRMATVGVNGQRGRVFSAPGVDVDAWLPGGTGVMSTIFQPVDAS